MKFQSFLKVYFIYISSLDYYIYKKKKLFNFKNNFFNNSLKLFIDNKKYENNLIYELKLLLILEQLFQFNVISNKFITNKYIFMFLDNLTIFYYKICFYKLIYLWKLKYLNFSNLFSRDPNFLLEMFLFNFKISFWEFNKISFLFKLKKIKGE